MIGTVKQTSIRYRVEFLFSQMAVNADQGAILQDVVVERGHKVAQKVASAYTASIYPHNLYQLAQQNLSH